VRITEASGDFLEWEPLRADGDVLWLSVRGGTRWISLSTEEVIHRSELSGLIKQLQALQTANCGAVIFRAQENWINLTFAMGKREDLAITAVIQSRPDFLHEVRLVLNIPQALLGQIIESFCRLLEFSDGPS